MVSQTRITTKYTIKPPPAALPPPTESKPLPRPTESSKPDPPRATLTLKTYDPASGTTLKYSTTKQAEVSRLIQILGRLARPMAGLTEVKEELVEGEAVGTPVTETVPVVAQGKGAQGAGGGQGQGAGGKKKKKGKKWEEKGNRRSVYGARLCTHGMNSRQGLDMIGRVKGQFSYKWRNAWKGVYGGIPNYCVHLDVLEDHSVASNDNDKRFSYFSSFMLLTSLSYNTHLSSHHPWTQIPTPRTPMNQYVQATNEANKFAPGDLAIYAKHCEEEKRYATQNIQIWDTNANDPGY
jgi:hypothetical protein